MANTITSIIDSIFARGLMALRENSIMPRVVNTDYSADAAQQGQVVTIPIPSAGTAADVTPAETPPAGENTAPTVAQVTLSKWRKTDMHLTDKEAKEAAVGLRDLEISAKLRTLANDVDDYILALYPGVYGYVGTAGTTPFDRTSNAYDLLEATQARTILNTQLAPLGERRIVLGPDAEGNAMMVRAIQDASFRRGGSDTLSNGMIGTVLGFDWYMDQNIPTHTAGTITTGLAAKTSTAQAVGLETIVATTAAATGACALLVGDIIAIAGDSQTYTLTAAATQASAATDVNLAISPPLKVALTGDEAITVKASHVVNLALHRDAIAFASRVLAPADGFTGGHEIRSVADPVSGLTLTLEVSREYARTKYEWRILYGATLVRPELACRIAG